MTASQAWTLAYYLMRKGSWRRPRLVGIAYESPPFVEPAASRLSSIATIVRVEVATRLLHLAAQLMSSDGPSISMAQLRSSALLGSSGPSGAEHTGPSMETPSTLRVK